MPSRAGAEAVELINPMNTEQSQMRRSIIPGLLRCVASNISHGTSNAQLYETGTVFTTSEGRKLPRERSLLAAALSGSWRQAGWNEDAAPIDFFDGKGIIESLARELNTAKLRFTALSPEEAPWLQPGRAAEVKAGSLVLGWLGELHPLALAAFGIEVPVTAFELELKALLGAASEACDCRTLPIYPAVQLDIALIVDEQVTAERVMQALRRAGGALLWDLRLFDVYRDAEKIGRGRKSLAFSLSYRSPERTLTSREVEKLHAKVLRAACAATGGELRA
jgi:phenylalanyl-tRNA synthetase beta chain